MAKSNHPPRHRHIYKHQIIVNTDPSRHQHPPELDTIQSIYTHQPAPFEAGSLRLCRGSWGSPYLPPTHSCTHLPIHSSILSTHPPHENYTVQTTDLLQPVQEAHKFAEAVGTAQMELPPCHPLTNTPTCLYVHPYTHPLIRADITSP